MCNRSFESLEIKFDTFINHQKEKFYYGFLWLLYVIKGYFSKRNRICCCFYLEYFNLCHSWKVKLVLKSSHSSEFVGSWEILLKRRGEKIPSSVSWGKIGYRKSWKNLILLKCEAVISRWGPCRYLKFKARLETEVSQV